MFLQLFNPNQSTFVFIQYFTNDLDSHSGRNWIIQFYTTVHNHFVHTHLLLVAHYGLCSQQGEYTDSYLCILISNRSWKINMGAHMLRNRNWHLRAVITQTEGKNLEQHVKCYHTWAKNGKAMYSKILKIFSILRNIMR